MKSAYWSGEAVIDLFLGQEPDFYFEIVEREAVIHTAEITHVQLILALANAVRARKLTSEGASILRSMFETAVDSGRIVLLWNGVPEPGELHTDRLSKVLTEMDATSAAHFATAKEGHFKRIVLSNSLTEQIALEWTLKPIVPPTKRSPGKPEPTDQLHTPLVSGDAKAPRAASAGKKTTRRVKSATSKRIVHVNDLGAVSNEEIAVALKAGKYEAVIVDDVKKWSAIRTAGNRIGIGIKREKHPGDKIHLISGEPPIKRDGVL